MRVKHRQFTLKLKHGSKTRIFPSRFRFRGKLRKCVSLLDRVHFLDRTGPYSDPNVPYREQTGRFEVSESQNIDFYVMFGTNQIYRRSLVHEPHGVDLSEQIFVRDPKGALNTAFSERFIDLKIKPLLIFAVLHIKGRMSLIIIVKIDYLTSHKLVFTTSPKIHVSIPNRKNHRGDDSVGFMCG